MRLKPKGGWRRVFLSLLLLAAVFWLGLDVGSGRISWRPHQAVSGNLPAKLDYSSVNQIYKSLRENYDRKLTESQLEDGLKHGLAEATKDPYTEYFTAKEAKDFNDQLNQSFSGVGAQLGQDKDGNLDVLAPIDGLAADKAGLKAKDIITSVNGESNNGMSVDEAVSKIRGRAGTVVKLKVVRNRAQPLHFAIARQDINLPSVKTKVLP